MQKRKIIAKYVIILIQKYNVVHKNLTVIEHNHNTLSKKNPVNVLQNLF